MSFRILFQSMWCIILMGSIGLILLWIVISNHHYFSSPYGANTLVNTWIRNMEFEGFNNETGVDHFIVPNIVHFIRFNQTEFTFVDYLCLQSAYRRQRPDYVFIHADKISFHGKYWSLIERDLELKAKIKIIHLELPSEIFGQPLNPEWRRWHGSDVARIRTMMKYGGIYLDNDVFVIQNLDKYRRFEISLEWQVDNQLNTSIIGNQIIIAHKDARFLAHWLDSYRSYRLNSWYYNAGEKPAQEILPKRPELIHRVEFELGAANTHFSWSLYNFNKDFEWRHFYSIHLMINHRFYLDFKFIEMGEFNEKNIRRYPYPFGQMANELIDNFDLKF